MSFKKQIITDKLPQHIAIIMDGNGRWAAKQGKDRVFGHQYGVGAVRNAAEAAAELGVKYLTLYAFSTENWNRPQIEVDALMHLFVETIEQEFETLKKNNIRLHAIGDLASLPAENYTKLMDTIKKTSEFDRMTLTLAMSYSSRWEIVDAVKKIVNEQGRQNNKIEITEKYFSQKLSTVGMPDPELLIRTSGESRLSNFLLWQLAYSELYFTQKLWPEFEKEDLYEAIVDYQKRERRFGLTSQQIKRKKKE
ncbi:MAG: isoprenyl transferase [Marinilabiliales bacterium]|jgi:undecaprenyl diphosphate synthase|nr:MAG: isoprenyl transferase [Marinilabiliales bacterium]